MRYDPAPRRERREAARVARLWQLQGWHVWFCFRPRKIKGVWVFAEYVERRWELEDDEYYAGFVYRLRGSGDAV